MWEFASELREIFEGKVTKPFVTGQCYCVHVPFLRVHRSHRFDSHWEIPDFFFPNMPASSTLMSRNAANPEFGYFISDRFLSFSYDFMFDRIICVLVTIKVTGHL